MGKYRCEGAQTTLSPYKQRVKIVNLLGFWAQIRRETENFTTPANLVTLEAFGFVKCE